VEEEEVEAVGCAAGGFVVVAAEGFVVIYVSQGHLVWDLGDRFGVWIGVFGDA
jgi:hypothetical protein